MEMEKKVQMEGVHDLWSKFQNLQKHWHCSLNVKKKIVNQENWSYCVLI